MEGILEQASYHRSCHFRCFSIICLIVCASRPLRIFGECCLGSALYDSHGWSYDSPHGCVRRKMRENEAESKNTSLYCNTHIVDLHSVHRSISNLSQIPGPPGEAVWFKKSTHDVEYGSEVQPPLSEYKNAVLGPYGYEVSLLYDRR